MSRTSLGYLMITLAALCWATLGVQYTVAVRDLGIHPLALAAYRALIAGGVLGFAFLSQGMKGIRVRREHGGLMLLYVVGGVAVFYAVYVYAVILVGVSVAVVLLYTAPAWVALMAWLFLGESITPRTLTALALTWVGVVLVARAYDVAQLRMNGVGMLVGMAAGFTYGLYSILQKVLVQHYRPWTVQWYGLFGGGLILIPFLPRQALLAPISRPEVYPWLLSMALGSTLLPGLLYTTGVQWVPVSVASIVATLEPVAATLFGYIFLGERLGSAQWVGAISILMAVWMLRPQEHGKSGDRHIPARRVSPSKKEDEGKGYDSRAREFYDKARVQAVLDASFDQGGEEVKGKEQ